MSTTVIYFASFLLMAAGIGFIYLILQGGSSRRPEGAVEWTATVVSAGVILSAAGLLLVTAFPEVSIGARSNNEGAMGRTAPPFRFRMVDTDEERALKDYRGQVVLLNLWATWCPPCLDEIPELNRFQQTYGPQGVAVVTVSDEPRQTILDFEEETMQLETENAYLPDAFPMPAPYDRVKQSRPTTFVIDRQGIIRDVWGGAADFNRFRQAVEPLL